MNMAIIEFIQALIVPNNEQLYSNEVQVLKMSDHQLSGANFLTGKHYLK